MNNYTLIDKNYFIPFVMENQTLDNCINTLKTRTLNVNKDYFKNIYVLCMTKNNCEYVIFSDVKYNLYKLTNYGITPFTNEENQYFDYNNIKLIDEFLNSNYNNDTMTIDIDPNFDIKSDVGQSKDEESEEVNNKIKRIVEMNMITNDDDNDVDVMDECEKYMELYNKKKTEKKNVEMNLKQVEKKKEKLLEEKKRILQDKIIKLRGTYNVYKNIRNAMGDEEIIPPMFDREYNYFKSLNDIELKMIDGITDDYIMYSEKYDDNILELADKYNNYYKDNIKMVKRFDHEWNELENEVVTGTFNYSK